MNAKTVDDIAIDDCSERAALVVETDIVAFSDVSGDKCPTHIVEEDASSTLITHQIAHCIYISSFIVGVSGSRLCSYCTIYASRAMVLLVPAYVNDSGLQAFK